MTRLVVKKNKVIDFGDIKILDKTTKGTNLPSEFDQLPKNYCSLWQSVEVYKKIGSMPSNIKNKLLTGLNDIVYNPKIAQAFKKEEAFKVSLLRSSEAEKAYKEGLIYLKGKKAINQFAFTFSCKLENASKPHKVKFNFEQNPPIPYRINALIGKNGTGKTQILANIANSLSGLKTAKGKFENERPPFSKVIAVSYSVFDDFKRPGNNSSNRTSYKYCGLRNEKGQIYLENLVKISETFQQIIKLDRRTQWVEILQETIKLEKLIQLVKESSEFKKTKLINLGLSSGQNIILSIISDIIANIQPESLILFDEPETHLHPNLVSSLMKSLYKLLEEFNSYAILSTHSPLIIQEIPSNYVTIIDREGNTPIIKKLEIESFGENLTAITHEVFQIDKSLNNYEEVLKNISKKLSYKKILNIFNNKLSLNAKIFLKSQYSKK